MVGDQDATRPDGRARPTLGFACHWNRPRDATWSGTPARLLTALREAGPVADLGTELPRPVREAAKAARAHRSDGHWSSTWRHDPLVLELVRRRIAREAARQAPDVVLEIQDIGVLDGPYLVLQDLSYAMLLERFGPDGIPHFRTLGRRRIEALRRRQDAVYAGAAGLLPMSRWMARSLAASGIDERRITVVNPGINTPVPDGAPVPERRQGSVRRLLLIGRDFDTKGGLQVVRAFALLREDVGPDITLTIAGPPTWPLAGEVPAGIDFRGPVDRATVDALMGSHDLFVMPSVFEGFGIAFAEALVRGLPCIGRDDCAMPEIIEPGSGGRLVRSEDPQELAELIVATLADDALYAACAREVDRRRAHYTWARAAEEIHRAAASVG